MLKERYRDIKIDTAKDGEEALEVARLKVLRSLLVTSDEGTFTEAEPLSGGLI